MVKKRYIVPELLVVQLGTVHMMAESLPVVISDDDSKKITNSGDILVKENTTTDVNLWDKEW